MKQYELLGLREFPTKEDPTKKKTMWTQIGRAFQNKDGSHTLYFDYFPTSPEIKIQLREKQDKPDRGGNGKGPKEIPLN